MYNKEMGEGNGLRTIYPELGGGFGPEGWPPGTGEGRGGSGLGIGRGSLGGVP